MGSDTDAVSGEHSRQGAYDYLLDAQALGNQASVLTAGAAKRHQGGLTHVMPLFRGNSGYGPAHLLHGHGQKSVGQHFRLQVLFQTGFGCHQFSHFLEEFPRCHRIQCSILFLAEGLGKVGDGNATKDQIGIGDGKGTAMSVRGRTRITAGAFRTGCQPGAVKSQYGTASGCYRVYGHHGAAHAHRRNNGFVLLLEFACEVRNVGGSASHIKGDQLRFPPGGSEFDRSHYTTGRSGKECVLAAKFVHGREAAVGFHKGETAFQLRGQALCVGFQGRI